MLTLLFLLVSCAVATSSNSSSSVRGLAQSLNHQFRPLSCNNNPCSKRANWSTEGYDPTSGLVTIPCGHCITMDASGTLTFPHGLEIVGTLHFPSGTTVNIRTPFVRVFGRLIMRFQTTLVTGNAKVRITLINSPVDTSFLPLPENELACTGGSTPRSCHVGKKPIVVAGGRLDILALPPTCKTWVALKDVVKRTRLPVQSEPSPPALCGSTKIVQNFNGLPPPDWSSQAAYEVNGSFLIKDRRDDAEGAVWDLMGIRDCFVPNQTYLFRMRVRSIGSSSMSSCSQTGASCIRFLTQARFQSGTIGSQKGSEKQTDQRKNGVWHTLFASFTFSEEELAPGASSHNMLLVGGDTLDLELDDVSISLPPTFSNPRDICSGNMIRNGNLSVDHTYPMQVFGDARLSIVPSSAFRTDRRGSHLASIAAYTESCLVSGSRYNVSVKVRALTSVQSAIVMTFRLELTTGKISKRTVVSCPPSSGQWVKCESSFLVEEQFQSEELKSARFAFETEVGKLFSFEVMEWQCEFVELSEPFIILPAEGVEGCWGQNSEILITSHTTRMESAQVRRMVARPHSLGDGTVRVKLDQWIIPPVTEADQDQFPVEVALLSRNVVFEADDDPTNNLLGGHLIVMNTPSIAQRIEGVELRNFGRQGELGRYPIHFHLSRNVRGSIISKNSIRNSNQRCVVIHGSHNVTVSGNIAHETSGHCYMLEDGGELDNRFIENLGATTRAARSIVRSFETDKSNPSTFWISNPANTYVGNVAAGCESTGFWLELNFHVRSPTSDLPTSTGLVPRTMPLGVFRDNIAHSNVRYGLRTYPNGFDPPDEAVFVNTKAYKNGRAGVFFHNSRNLKLQGGIMADNRVQVDLDRADNIAVNGTAFLGNSDRFKEIVATESTPFGTFDHLVGLQLHGFTLDPLDDGATIANVQFGGFANSLAPYATLIDVDETKSSGHFDYWTTIHGVRLLSGSRPLMFNFLRSRVNGVRDIILHDLDGSMNPDPARSAGSGLIISSSPEMTEFLDTSQCSNKAYRGFMYCRNICLRTLSFQTSPAETENVELLIHDANDESKSFLFQGHFHHETLDDGSTADAVRNTWIKKRRVFAASLPAGRYNAIFVENGQPVWPTFVEEVEAPAFCQPVIAMNSLSLTRPKPIFGECKELIRNGDLDMSSTRAPYWFHHKAGLNLLPEMGYAGSNALSDTTLGNSPDAYLGQFVDTRCIVHRRQFEFLVRLQIQNGTGQIPECESASSCPTLQLRFRPAAQELGFEQAITITDSLALSVVGGKWGILHGTYTVDSRLATAPYVAVAVTRGSHRGRLVLDHMSMTVVPRSCSELVFNSDFVQTTTSHWKTGRSNSGLLEFVQVSGKPALRHFSRKSAQDVVVQNIRSGCLKEGDRYSAFARVRLLGKGSGVTRSCDRTKRTGNTACPRFQLQSFVNIGLSTQQSHFHHGGQIAHFDSGKSPDGWYVMTGLFTGTKNDEMAEKTVLRLGDSLHKDIDLLIDEVSIKPLPFQCTNLLVNGDFEAGSTAQFWGRAIFSSPTLVDIVRQGNNKLLKLSNRESNSDGVVQQLDHRCFTANTSWIASAQMKLTSETNGSVVSCDPLSTLPLTTCPPLRIIGNRNGVQIVDSLFYVNNARWNSAGAWKTFEVTFVVDSQLASCDQVWLGVRSFNKEWILMVDDFTLTPSNRQFLE